MASNAENISIWWRHHVFITVENMTQARLPLEDFDAQGQIGSNGPVSYNFAVH